MTDPQAATPSEETSIHTYPFTYQGTNVDLVINRAYDISGGPARSATVFKATLSGGTLDIPIAVAAKVLGTAYTMDTGKAASKEVERWKDLNHPNILRFYGWCTFGLGQLCLVSPLMERGNMRTFLRGNLDPGTRLELLRQVADALVYLHMHMGRVHGDLKCANVLISDDKRALLCDFGLSTLIERTDPTLTLIRKMNTLVFAAPEVLMDRADDKVGVLPLEEDGVAKTIKPRSKTRYSDIYAFGMLIYEAHAGAAPWEGEAEWDIPSKVNAGERPNRPEGEGQVRMSDGLWELCNNCWKGDPKDRPLANNVLNTLTSLAGAVPGGSDAAPGGSSAVPAA
ncbi:kinase-like protein [Auricularia subglabra TFB-10046 SS5]|nr:kinase-like protein [Auricularia subglabra TFB-10046 SS5]